MILWGRRLRENLKIFSLEHFEKKEKSIGFSFVLKEERGDKGIHL